MGLAPYAPGDAPLSLLGLADQALSQAETQGEQTWSCVEDGAVKSTACGRNRQYRSGAALQGAVATGQRAGRGHCGGALPALGRALRLVEPAGFADAQTGIGAPSYPRRIAGLQPFCGNAERCGSVESGVRCPASASETGGSFDLR
nr:hypothetical protein [Tanacetum cinerariifolium]